MLDRLIEKLQAGGTYSLSELARELQTTPALVEMMLENLSRAGYVHWVNDRCAGSCGGCTIEGCHSPAFKNIRSLK